MNPFLQDFDILDHWLFQHRALWQFDAFASLHTPWQETYPELAHYLDHAAFQTLSSPSFLEEVFALCPSLAQSQHWQKIPNLSIYPERQDYPSVPSYLYVGIKGRKWQQITAFSTHTPLYDHYVEWCSGKGHLGKLLAYQGESHIHSLEWQKTLCEEGRKQAERLNLNQRFTQADVLKGEGKSALVKNTCAVALHACGDLHRELIEQAVAESISALCLSPCCYHLTKDEQYLPLSHHAKGSPLSLRKADLKLAVKEVATAGAREKRLKETELTYRLGFDAWQRKAQNKTDYLPVPSIQKAILNQGFDAFCRWAAEQKGLTQHIQTCPFDGFEKEGEKRYQQVQKLEAISQLFRPALEYWLILDRAMYLKENGYQVEIGAFCEKELTPRNWMIRACKH